MLKGTGKRLPNTPYYCRFKLRELNETHQSQMRHYAEETNFG